MTTNKNVTFPGWEVICKTYVNKYQKELNLAEGFHDHFCEQFKILSDNLFNEDGGIRKLHSRRFEDNKKNVLHPSVLEEKLLISRKLQDQLGANQFLTLYNSREDNFDWVDERVSDVLKIPIENFTIPGIRGFNHELNLYHPMDVLHFMRYGTLAYLVSSLKGIEYTAMRDFYSVSFRMGIDDGNFPEGANKSSKLVERRCFPVTMNSHNRHDSSHHLDVWTISDNAESQRFVRPVIEMVGRPKLTKFLNTLFFMYNAKVLRFSPKDLVVLRFTDDFDQPEESRSSLNRAIRKLTGEEAEFAAKPFTDFSYSLNKKLTKSLKLYSLNGENESSYFNRLNRLNKAKRLGLLPLTNELNDLILSAVL